MPELIFSLLLMAGGILVLLRGGDYFVDASVSLGYRLKIPPIIMGATLVSFSTSLPETSVSFMAHVFRGAPAVAVGNVVGSNICNLGLILSLGGLIRPMKFHRLRNFSVQTAVLLTANLLLILFLNLNRGVLPRIAGLVFLGGLIFYFYLSVRLARSSPQSSSSGEEYFSLPQSIAFFLLGLVAVLWGSDLLIRGTLRAAFILRIPRIVIALTVVALGTSLPELTTLLASLKKGHHELTVGNLMGANILNILQTLGLTAFVRPLPFPRATAGFDVPFMLFLAVALPAVILFTRKFSRLPAGIFLALYLIYVFYFQAGQLIS